MSQNHEVEFTAGVSAMLPPDFHKQLSNELLKVFTNNCPTNHAPQRIIVSRCFHGFTPEFPKRIVLGVEIRWPDRYETHIVKLGERSEVTPDADGWNECTQGRQVASRIFAPVSLIANLDGDRAAVLYRDAYTFFGLDTQRSRSETLETAAEWSVRDDRPEPLSVERAIAHIFTDLGRWFFPGSRTDKELAARFYRRRLRVDSPTEDQILSRWRTHPARCDLRRDAVWLRCGRDRPDADPVACPATYLDPVDFVEWILTPGAEERLPNTLVGRSHGDLHGRNSLVGVRRGEAEYPAVFDYGEMSAHNVLAWDFAKLEMELRVRILPTILADANVSGKLLGLASPPAFTVSSATRPTVASERAHRVRLFVAFEELLHDMTQRIFSRDDAELLTPIREVYRTGSEKLDRLLAILLRIRKEAALWLGFEQFQRRDKWQDEFYFAVAVYGLLNVRWNYEPPQVESALIAAGVAAARMPSTPLRLQQCIEQDGRIENYPSYRVPLRIAHSFWKQRQYEQGREVIERTVFDVEKSAAGERTAIRIRPNAGYAIPLVVEGALLEMECGLARLAEPLLEQFRPLAREFGDYETLGRIGRVFKDSGDRRWDTTEFPFSELRKSAAFQMYTSALAAYEEAFLATKDYYTGINAATLAQLTGNQAKATLYAGQVLEICEQMKDIPRQDRFWIFATEGEAALHMGNWKEAKQFYEQALAELSPGQGGMADSAYKQLCRLWKVFEAKLERKVFEDNVEPILKMFERGEFRASLTPGLLGRQMVPLN